MGVPEEKEEIFKRCRKIGTVLAIGGLLFYLLLSGTNVGFFSGILFFIGLLLYLITLLFELPFKRTKDNKNKDGLEKVTSQQISKTAESIERPKQSKQSISTILKTLNHWSVGVILIGILMSCSPSLIYLGIGVIVLGVGGFVVKIRNPLWGIPFFLVFIVIAAVYWHTHGPSIRKEFLPNPDGAADADIRKAYKAAMAYFNDYPNGTVTLPKLTAYGFVPTSNYTSINATLEIISGNRPNLRITASHPDAVKVYTVHSDGAISFRLFGATRKAAQNAYAVAMGYFADYPNGTVTLPKLTSYGFFQENGVILEIISGRKNNLKIIVGHIDEAKKYTIDNNGIVSSKN